MGQEYSGQYGHIPYPEAIGYIEKHKSKGKNKYHLKRVEIKSFSNIPYSKYVPLNERNTPTYKRTLTANNTTNKPAGRLVSIAPRGYGAANKSPTQQRKQANSNGQVANKNSRTNNVSFASTNTTGSNKSKGTKSSNNVSFESANTTGTNKSTSSKVNAAGGKKKFVAKSDKEAQLQKIYIKTDDLVIEMPRKSKKTGKKKKKVEAKPTDNKKKALFKIRNKLKVEPSPVYLESPFKRQKTIRIKKNKIGPIVGSSDKSDNQSDKSKPNTAKRIRTSSLVRSEDSRLNSEAQSLQLSVIGTKANLFDKEEEKRNGTPNGEIKETDELTQLFHKRTLNPPQTIKEERLARMRTFSEGKEVIDDEKPKPIQSKDTARPKSSPYHALPFVSKGVVFPGYKSKKNLGTKSAGSTKKGSKSAIHPSPLRKSLSKSGRLQGKLGNLKIVKGKKNDINAGRSDEPKIRLKWYNVLQRTHYQNRINSLYNESEYNETIDDLVESNSDKQVNMDNDINSTQSGKTYSDSCLSNTIVSSANATVTGELDHTIAEVEYEPSILSDVTVISTRNGAVSKPGDYDGDGDTDFDQSLKCKPKKSPEMRRKDLLKMQESYFRNNPGLEEDTSTSESDTDTLTGDINPNIGHVQKMRELFGAMEYNKKQSPPSRRRQMDIGEPGRYSPRPYKPSFMNQSNPSHLFNVESNKEPMMQSDLTRKWQQNPNKTPATNIGKRNKGDVFITESSHSLKPVGVAPTRKATEERKQEENKQPQAPLPRQIVVSPLYSDNDSLLDLEDAATLAVKMISVQPCGKPQESSSEKDNLDEILESIVNKRNNNGQNNTSHRQVNGEFQIETVMSNNREKCSNVGLEELNFGPEATRRSISYKNARAVFENNGLDFGNEALQVTTAATNDNEGFLHTSWDDQTSSDHAVLINDNYDKFARTVRKQSPAKKVDTGTTIHLPKIVNSQTLTAYSRHTPVQSKSGPSVTKTKPTLSDQSKSINAVQGTLKGNKFNGYTWRSTAGLHGGKSNSVTYRAATGNKLQKT